MNINDPQPAPQPSIHPAAWDLVLADMAERDRIGTAKYGVRLSGHDGRDSLVDAYQEALDQVVYLRKAIYERDHRTKSSRATKHERFDRNTWLMKLFATCFMAAALVLQLTVLAQHVVQGTDRQEPLMWGAMVTAALLVLCLQLPTRKP